MNLKSTPNSTLLVTLGLPIAFAALLLWKKKSDDKLDIVKSVLKKTAPVAAAEELKSSNEVMTCERKLNGVKLIITKDPKVANYIFNGPSNSNYVRRPASDEGLEKLGMLNQGLIWCNHLPTWKKIRGCFQKALNHDNIENAATVIKKEFKDLLENKLKEGNGSINMMSVCRCLTFRATLKTFFGIDASNFVTMGIEEQLFIDSIVSYFKAWEFFLLRPLKYWDDSSVNTHSKSVKSLQQHVKNMLASIDLSDSRDCKSNLFFDQLCAICINRDGKCDRDLLMQSSLEMLLAGTDTSSVTAYYALLGIANDTKLQEDIRADIQTNKDATKAKLLQSVINETLRFKPVGPVVLREAVDDDPKFPSEFRMTEGTAILIHLAEMNLTESIWTEPNNFCPRRFLGRKEQNFFPFGNGPKGCIGMHLGRREVSAIIEEVITNFELNIDGDGTLETLETHWDIANQPDNPLMINLTKIV